MPRLSGCLFTIVLGAALCADIAGAQDSMKPTAPQTMMPPAEKMRLRACQEKAARLNVKMDERAKFLMDCMKDMAK